MIRIAIAFAAFGFVLALSVSPQTVHNVNNAAQEVQQ